MEIVTFAVAQYIKLLESEGKIDPDCKSCQEYFYPQLKAGRKLYDIFAPAHKAMDHCRSGKYPHCTCDSCF